MFDSGGRSLGKVEYIVFDLMLLLQVYRYVLFNYDKIKFYCEYVYLYLSDNWFVL